MAIIKPGQLSSGPYSISGSFSGSFTGDGSRLINVPTQSFETGSFVLTSSFNAFTGSYNTGSFTGSFTGSLLGVASTASYVLNAVSSSFSTTASYAIQALSASFAPSTPPFPFTGSALITGSLGVTGSFIVSSSIGNLISVSSSQIILNGPGGTAFTPSIALRRNGANAFYIDEYGSKFNDIVYLNTIYAPGTSGITLGNQSGGGKIIYTVPTQGTLAIGYASQTTNAALDVRTQGALSTDIAFRVRNSADTADLISFRGDGSEWIQSVPFRHAGNLSGGTNAAQSLYVGYNSVALASTGTRNTIIGTGIGNSANGNDLTAIGWGVSVGGFNTSIAIGAGATLNANNQCVIGSQTYPFSVMSIGTGGTVTSAAAVQNMTFSVGGVAGGFTLNTDLSSRFFRIQSQGGSGTGNGAPIQFSVAPSGTSGFNANNFVIPLEIRGDAAGLNHYQLATPRVPAVSITDGYIQYSNDITAGNAAPHFRTETGSIIRLYQQPAVTSSQGLADVLTNLGFLTGSSTIANPSAFPFTGSAQITGSLGVTGSTSFMTTGSGVASLFTFTAGGIATSPYVRVVTSDGVSEVALTATRLAGTGVTSTAINRGFLYLGNAAGATNVIGSNEGIAFSAATPAGYDPINDQMRLKNGNLAIGTNYTGTARLDVRAQGALSTDIAFRVRNSTDTFNILAAQGDGNIQIGSDAVGTTRTVTIAGTNTSQINLDTSFSTDTATISVARRISPTFNTNTLLFSQNSFADGNVQPYRFHFVNPSTYWGYTEPGFSMIRDAGFMFFKDSATAANLQMKLTPDNVLTMYTGSLGATPVPTEVPVTGSAFQLFASSSNNTVVPVFIPRDGKRIQLYAQGPVTSSQGLADTLTNLGFLTGSSTIATPSAFPFTGSALITGSLSVTGSVSSQLVSPSSFLWQTHFSGERFDGSTLQGRVYIKTNYPFVEDFYIGKNNGSANNDTSTNGGIHYSHNGVFTVRNTQTSGFFGVTLNANQNLTQRVGIDSGNTSFSEGWSLRNFTNSTDYINFAHNSNRVGIGWNDKTTSLLGATLDVKAQGALSTDIAFRVRNSANTQNLMSLTGDGRIAIGLNAQILGTTDAFKNVVIGGLAKDISAAGVTENSVALGYNAVSNNGGTALGANTQIVGASGVAVGASAYAGIDSTAIGAGARADATSLYQSLAIGRGARASALLSGIIAVGQVSYTNALAQTLAFCVDPVGANSQTMLLTNKANLVFRNSTQLTSGTHWDTTATNTLTIHSGSIPATTISGAFQFYAATGSISNNVRPHFITGNGTTVWLGDESRLFNVTASNITASSLTIPSGSVTITTGSVTMPNRPAFSVYGAGTTNNLTTTQNGDGTLNSNNYATIYYQGTGFDASTGIFTAPIAGLYQVDVIGRNAGFAGGISQLAVIRNNSNGAGEVLMIEWAASSTMNHAGGSKIYRLAVGDTLRLKVLAGQINFDGNDNWSVAYIG